MDFVVTWFSITLIDLSPYLSHGIGWLVATGCSFQLNRMWVFEDRGKAQWKFTAFFALAFFALVSGTGLLYLLNQIAELNFYFAKLCAMLTVSVVNYMVVSRFIFTNRDSVNFKNAHS